jgi:hypothetical protein
MNEDVDDLSSAGLKGVGDRFVDAMMSREALVRRNVV